MLGRKARRAVPLACHVLRPNRTIEQRLGALSGLTSRLDVNRANAWPYDWVFREPRPPRSLQIQPQLICFYAAKRVCIQLHMVLV